MTDDPLETRLRATMLDQAARVEPAPAMATAVTSELESGRPTARARRSWPRIVVPVLGGVAAVALAAALTAEAGNQGQHATHGPAASVPAARPKIAAPAATFTYVRDIVGGRTVASETWIPADLVQTWQFFNPNMDGASRVDRGACAAFPHYVDANGKVPGCDGGSWDMYRPKFADSLPDDPHAVLASMRTALDGPSDASTFNTGWNFLSLGWVQPRAVAKVVDALKLIHGVRVRSLPGGRTELSYSGYLKRTVREFWSLTVDAQHRVVSTGFSYGKTKTLTDTFTYKTVPALGDH